MNIDFHSEVPIYLQIAREIEEAILTGAFAEEEQIPSTTELSKGFQINPATVLKGMNILVDEEFIYKKRGLGMFVTEGAQKKIKLKRNKEFYNSFIEPMLLEGNKLGLSSKDIMQMIKDGEK